MSLLDKLMLMLGRNFILHYLLCRVWNYETPQWYRSSLTSPYKVYTSRTTAWLLVRKCVVCVCGGGEFIYGVTLMAHCTLCMDGRFTWRYWGSATSDIQTAGQQWRQQRCVIVPLIHTPPLLRQQTQFTFLLTLVWKQLTTVSA